jgi:pimeloyl-ACP methyl ester carboxylesterase
MSDDAGGRRVHFDVPGGVIAGYAFGDERGPPDVVFLHATGFNARAYRTLLAPLGVRFRVLAIDLRGHGRTTLPAGRLGYASWNRHRDDVIRLLESHVQAPVVFAGHSMGATTGLLVAGVRPDLVRGLALIDPVITSRETYAVMLAPGAPLVAEQTWPIARKAAGRREAFESREAARAAFHGRSVFKSFSDEALDDYLADGLLDDESAPGAVRLACSPAFEARTFAAQRHNPWSAWLRAPSPILVLRAGLGSTFAERSVAHCSALRSEARIITVEGATHMLPFERPDRVRATIESAVVMSSSTALYRDVV